jgi:hypothetical protein
MTTLSPSRIHFHLAATALTAAAAVGSLVGLAGSAEAATSTFPPPIVCTLHQLKHTPVVNLGGYLPCLKITKLGTSAPHPA